MNEVTKALNGAIDELFGQELAIEVSRPEEHFGDFATNAALQLATKLNKNPREIAEAIAAQLKPNPLFANVSVAGPGFINMKLPDSWFINQINLASSSDYGRTNSYENQQIVVEYSDPNPFKVLHAGHLYTSIVGDAIANLFERAGATTHRVNFGGDVGLHVAKTMWAMIQALGGQEPAALSTIAQAERSQWMANCYVHGNNIYDQDPDIKAQIIELNKQIYQISNTNERTSPLAQIYWATRQWSYDYFDQFYGRIGTHFEKYYPESQTAGPGLAAVQAHTPGVFEPSDGAVVFNGEKYGLHTRVFVNSEGLPTYEAKDVGLALSKWQDYHYDKSVIITGNEQEQYLAVVLKAIEQFEPDLAKKTAHLTHGIVKLKGGVKMSSRLGNILKATDILDAAAEANQQAHSNSDASVVLGAVKYSFLKQRLGADIIYDPEESVSLAGNSGPYLQYAYARAGSILDKVSQKLQALSDLDGAERSLARKISEYPEVVEKATAEMLPHYITTYLYELAQSFNRFYEGNRVVGDSRETTRAAIVLAYKNVLGEGLGSLGIGAPERV